MNDCQDPFIDIYIALKPLLNKLTNDGNGSLHMIKSLCSSYSVCTQTNNDN